MTTYNRKSYKQNKQNKLLYFSKKFQVQHYRIKNEKNNWFQKSDSVCLGVTRFYFFYKSQYLATLSPNHLTYGSKLHLKRKLSNRSTKVTKLKILVSVVRKLYAIK